MIEKTYNIFTYRPQSPPIANKIIPGDSANRKGTNKLLKFLKKIRFLFFSFELINKINNGPKPIKIIKKYLIKISKEYLFILC